VEIAPEHLGYQVEALLWVTVAPGRRPARALPACARSRPCSSALPGHPGLSGLAVFRAGDAEVSPGVVVTGSGGWRGACGGPCGWRA
jgi:hypothetical protein